MPKVLAKRKHTVVTVKTKLEILDKLDKGVKGSLLARQYGLGSATVSEIKLNAHKIRTYASKHLPVDLLATDAPGPKLMKLGIHKNLDEAVFKWYCNHVNPGMPIRGVEIQAAATQLAEELGIKDFKSSNGWLFRFRRRHLLGNHKVCGESASADTSQVASSRAERERISFSSSNDGQRETKQDDDSEILSSNANSDLAPSEGKVQRKYDEQSNASTSVNEGCAENSKKECNADSAMDFESIKEEAVDVTDIPVCSNKEIEPEESDIVKEEPIEHHQDLWKEDEENVSSRLKLPELRVVLTRLSGIEDNDKPENIMDLNTSRTLPSPANLSKMPKTAKQKAPQQESSASLVEEEADVLPEVLPDVPDDTNPDVDVVNVQPVAGPSRKRIRPSKKDVPDYPFNDVQLREIANYVQLHPELYDKRNEKWLNPAWKESLWKDLAQTFSNCSYQQVKKVVEKKRTDFGKIEKRESKSGSAARPRTQREQKIVDVWGFLAGHIAHETTHPSDDFGRKGEDQDSSSQESGLSAHSIVRRKRQKKRREEELSSPRPTKSTQESSGIQELLQSAQLLATRKPPVEGPDADIRQFVEFMYTRLKKVSPMHHGVLFSKIAYMISLMEEPVMGRSAIKDPRRLLDSVPMPPGVAGPSHLWQPPPPPTPAPPPPVYHPPQYQQTQYQQPQYSQPQYQQQQYQQPQQSEQQQFPQQPQQRQVSPSPVKTKQYTSTTTKLHGQKTKSPAKKAPMSSMIETLKGYEAEESDEEI